MPGSRPRAEALIAKGGTEPPRGFPLNDIVPALPRNSQQIGRAVTNFGLFDRFFPGFARELLEPSTPVGRRERFASPVLRMPPAHPMHAKSFQFIYTGCRPI